MRTSRALPTLAVAMLTLAACGGGDDSTEDDDGGGEDTAADENGSDGGGDAGGGELTPVTVAAIPIADTAAVWLGVDEGFFEEEGLDVTITTTGGGAEAMAGVVSGENEFAFSNVISIMLAVEQGLDVRFVTNGTSAEGSEGGFGALVVSEDSEIQSADELEGLTVSVNNFSNITGATASYSIEAAGGDPDTVEWVEIAFPDAQAAVEAGNVDAAMIVEPFITAAVESGNRVIAWPFQEIPDLDIAGYFASGDTIENDPELVASFRSAMNRSLEYAAENPDAVRDIIGTYTEIPEDVLAEIALPTFRTEFNVEAMTELGEAATRFGILAAEPDLELVLPLEE
ncbi:ABC transporter substrate-binding protein [Georgenia sp. Z1491]|uniref:ABC transporter substrate-binding protein n=1 Tax=Georgenia sp. Z1491 TaxID=3416707 RepID=UPI003CF17B0A